MKSYLITGGAGFFGRAMTRRLLDDGLSDRVCIYSRDEYKQFLMRQEFNNDERLRFFIGDVRDKERFRRASMGVDVVFHAAALKRIETCFYNPEEMLKTNCLGTQNVVDVCEESGIACVVLSTDKACQPISPYGYSKALAERIALGAGAAVTRYGNVFNSTGSVYTVWKDISPVVPVTDPEATRFFMTEDEAVDLVLDTADEMPEEIVTPVLPAYRLADLAEAMGKGMSVIGLPPYEKKHESMVEGEPSNEARRMTVQELRDAIERL